MDKQRVLELNASRNKHMRINIFEYLCQQVLIYNNRFGLRSTNLYILQYIC